MARIICELPNASTCISGLEFEPMPEGKGMISKDDVPADVAERFAAIPGYRIQLKKAASKKAASKEPAHDEKPGEDDGSDAGQDTTHGDLGDGKEPAEEEPAASKKAASKKESA